MQTKDQKGRSGKIGYGIFRIQTKVSAHFRDGLETDGRISDGNPVDNAEEMSEYQRKQNFPARFVRRYRTDFGG